MIKNIAYPFEFSSLGLSFSFSLALASALLGLHQRIELSLKLGVGYWNQLVRPGLELSFLFSSPFGGGGGSS